MDDALPDWIADAIFYQVFPDRFATSPAVDKPHGLEPWDAPPTLHGYKGGDLRGLAERLDHITDLGANGLYLTPIFWSASNHRYHTYDFRRVDPMLGGDAAFDDLLAACAERSIRVVIDGVFNHVSRGFFAFHDLLENGEGSPYRDWFHVRRFPLNAYGPGPAGYDCWHGIPALPKLNTENPAVRAMLFDVAEHWARRGIAGWRLDTPQEIATPGFWEEVRARVRAIAPDLYLVGEIWTDASSWLGSRFDGTMGYWLGGHTLVYATSGRFRFDVATHEYPIVRASVDAIEYGDHIDHLLATYGGEHARANLNLFGSHDTPRALTLADGDRVSIELAALLLFTMPGAPCVYQGDEIGMEGGRDPDCRRGFPWDRARWDGALLETFRALARLRREHVALRRGRHRRLARDASVYAFAMEHEDEELWIATNTTEEPATVTLAERPARHELAFGRGELALLERGAVLTLPARSGAVFVAR